MESFTTLDVIVVAFYFLGVAYAGVYFGKRNKDTGQYFLGGRKIPSWAIGISMVGTSISSVTVLAFPADAYKTAWLRVLPNLTLPIAVLIAAYFFLPFFRQGNLTTAYEYLERRFGPGTRLYAAIVFCIGQLFRLGLVLFLLSLLVAQIFGIDVWLAVILCGIVVALYTVLGGIEAVIWTDVVQTFIIIGGSIACLGVIIYGLDGGFADIFRIGAEYNKFVFQEVTPQPGGTLEVHPPNWGFSFEHKTITMMLLVGLSMFLAEYSSNQNVVQRYAASRSAKAARQALLICALLAVPMWLFFMLLGSAIFVFFQEHPDPTALAMLEPGKSAEQIVPYFMVEYLPAGVTGLMVAAVMAAAMSSLDSSINAIATVSVVDIYRRHLRTDRDDQHYLNAARAIATVVGVLMIVMALLFAMMDHKTVQDTNLLVQAITAGGLLGLFLLGFGVPWGDGRAVAAGIALTVAFSLWMGLREIGILSKDSFPNIDGYYAGIIGHLIMFIIGFAGTALLGKTRDLRGLTWWSPPPARIEC